MLDATATILPWEKLNHSFIKAHQFGDSITSYSNITSLITSFLEKPYLLNKYKKNLKNIDKKNIEIELKTCIQYLLK
jgi:hypothetical protein